MSEHTNNLYYIIYNIYITQLLFPQHSPLTSYIVLEGVVDLFYSSVAES